MKNFLGELKRRNVYKVAVAYAVVGWLIIQVTATIVPALHLPDGLTTAVVVLTLTGFPIALVIAWAFEMTPEGMKRTAEVTPTHSTVEPAQIRRLRRRCCDHRGSLACLPVSETQIFVRADSGRQCVGQAHSAKIDRSFAV